MPTRSGRDFSAAKLARVLAQHASELVAREETREDSACIPVSQPLAALVHAAVSMENTREDEGADDAEGLPLTYGSPFSSPLSSAPPSRCASPWPEDTDDASSDVEDSHAHSPRQQSSPLGGDAPPPSTPSLRQEGEHKKRRHGRTRGKRRGRKPSPGSSEALTDTTTAADIADTPAVESDLKTADHTAVLTGRAARRKRKRFEESLRREPGDYKIRSSLSERHRHSEGVKTTFDLRSLRAAKGAHIGLRRKIIRVSPALAARLNEGYKLVRWDGR